MNEITKLILIGGAIVLALEFAASKRNGAPMFSQQLQQLKEQEF